MGTMWCQKCGEKSEVEIITQYADDAKEIRELFKKERSKAV